MAEQMLPVPRTTRIKDFTYTGTYPNGYSLASDFHERLYNLALDAYEDKSPYATQRPRVVTWNFGDANPDGDASNSDLGSITARGRGLGSIQDVSGNYHYVWLNNLDLITYSYQSANSGAKITLTNQPNARGNSDMYRATFINNEAGAFMVDPASGNIRIINAAGTVSTPSGLPNVKFATGAVYLDTYTFIANREDGKIYNSNLNDSSVWQPGLQFITAEAATDGIIGLAKHHNNIVAFGATSIEFFYDAANPTGSPLSKRQDIQYNIGLASDNGFCYVGDDIYFLGKKPNGELSLHRLANFQLEPLTDPRFNTWLTVNASQNMWLTNIPYKGRTLVLMTLFTTPSAGLMNPQQTFVYDPASGGMYQWDMSNISAADIAGYPITETLGAHPDQVFEGANISILSNGDLVYLGYSELNGFSDENLDQLDSGDSGAVATTIDWSRTEFGTNRLKLCRSAELVGNYSSTFPTGTLYWRNDASTSFTTGVTLQLDGRDRVHRLGSYHRRDWRYSMLPTGTYSDIIEIQGLMLDISGIGK